MILHILTCKITTDFGTISGEVLPHSCKILQSPSQKFMQDLSGMISPDIVPKSVVILHTKCCKIIEVFNPRSCSCDLTGIIMRDLSRLFRHDLTRYSSKICSDFARSWILLFQDLASIFSWELIRKSSNLLRHQICCVFNGCAQRSLSLQI